MDKEQRSVLYRIIISALLFIAAFLIPVSGILEFALFALPYLLIGGDVLWGAAKNVLKGEIFDEKFLMSIATLGAFAIKEYPEAVAVMLFYQLGELFQDIAVGKSRKSISSLLNIRPDYAVVYEGGIEKRVSPKEVKTGDIIIVSPGEKVPLDGEIIEGFTSVNTSALTGESLPADKMPGDKVKSGFVNLTGLIKVRVEALYEESTVSKILNLVEKASGRKAKAENFITKFSRYYTPCVLYAAILIAVLPPLWFNDPFMVWINRALVFLVVSCPCALVVSVPLSFFAGIGGASRKGILIKGSNHLETLSKVKAFAFDKTGTLTKGSFIVNAVHPSEMPESELLEIAAAAESYSSHPAAEPIIKAYGNVIDKTRIEKTTVFAGMGLSAVIDGRTYYVGNTRLMDLAKAKWRPCHISGTIIHISEDDEYLGHIVINDQIKPDASDTIAKLKEKGINSTLMLTGDAWHTAKEIADKAGIENIRAELLPDQKVEALEELLSEGITTAYVGDGINDAPVLARADVGISMGAIASDAAIESADVVIMDDSLSKLPLTVNISRKTMKIVRQNIILSLGAKGIILLLGILGIANMWIAVIGDVGVMIIATLNAIRALKT